MPLRKVYGLSRMSDTNDATATAASAEAEGSETTPETKPTRQEDPIALARKRQAGAEAARQAAEEARDKALADLEVYRSKERSVEEQSLTDIAKLQERLAAAEKAAKEADDRANARILDTLYPNARKELPEVTDEVRLAKFEALLSDPTSDGAEPPPPQNPNESNRSASGDATSKVKEESSEDILARLKTMTPDWL
jgi:hypothetical protein